MKNTKDIGNLNPKKNKKLKHLKEVLYKLIKLQVNNKPLIPCLEVPL